MKNRRSKIKRIDSDGVADPSDADRVEIPGDVSETIFWDIADSFITQANSHGESVPAETVHAALMYAAARYSAFVAVSQQSLDQDTGNGERDPANDSNAEFRTGTSSDLGGESATESARESARDPNMDVELASDFFTLQYRKLFEENLTQYIGVPDVDTDSASDRDHQANPHGQAEGAEGR